MGRKGGVNVKGGRGWEEVKIGGEFKKRGRGKRKKKKKSSLLEGDSNSGYLPPGSISAK